MRLIVIDVVPALLSWEGRDASDPVPLEGAEEILDVLSSRYRLAAVSDGDRAATELRDVLDRLRIGAFFETIGTSADFGPRVSPRVIRRSARAVRVTPERIIVVTARPRLAASLENARMAAVLVEAGRLAELPERLRRLTGGPPGATAG